MPILYNRLIICLKIKSNLIILIKCYLNVRKLSLSFSVLFIIIVIDVIKHYLSRKTLLLLIILMPIVNIIRCQYYIID